MVLTLKEIKDDPDKVLNSKDKLKELVKDGKLVTELLKEKKLTELNVVVGGKTVHLVNTPPPLVAFMDK